MTVAEIYQQKRIHSGLQLHQLRVAAVGTYIAERANVPVDVHSVVLACLFHDMGNIIKSDMTSLPTLWEPEGVVYWEQVKKEVVQKYGADEHVATVAIAREIGVSEQVLPLIDGIGFSNVHAVVERASLEQKICEYADVRVGPFGVLSMRERLENWYVRYKERMADRGVEAAAYYENLVRDFTALETQLKQSADFHPDDITDEAVAKGIEELKDIQV